MNIKIVDCRSCVDEEQRSSGRAEIQLRPCMCGYVCRKGRSDCLIFCPGNPTHCVKDSLFNNEFQNRTEQKSKFVMDDLFTLS